MSDSLEGLDFYKVLEVSKDATEAEIRSNYRKLARKWHPDRNQDKKERAEANFKRISKAYEVLSDAEKRKIYDAHGEAGLEQGAGPGGFGRDPFDIFGDIFGFGGGGRQRQQQGPKKTEDLVYAISLSLREFYKGRVRRLQITKDIICAPCKGSGSKNPAAGDTTCSKCRGSGTELRVIQQPGMMQQFRTTCSQCQGQGSVIAAADRCPKCHGAKVCKEKFTEEVNIRPGMRAGEKITLHGEANQAPGCEPGDIILVLKERDGDDVEQQFERRGDDLLVKQKITLAEALCGYKRQLQHLDDRWIFIQSPDGAVVKPGDVHYIEDEGMPCTSNPALKGYLLVQFDIEFPKPDELSLDARSQLLQLLPSAPAPQPRPDAEMCVARVGSSDTSSERTHRSPTDAAQQDEERETGGVRCAQQ